MSTRQPRKRAVAKEIEPPQPGWRKPPPRPRRKMRRTPAVTFDVRELNSRTSKPIASALLPRPAAKQAKRRPGARVKWGRWVAGVLVTAALAFGIIQLFTNERFFVYTAQITGNERVSWETIYATSGIDQTNIFWVRPGEVARRLTALPDIATAHARVRLPNQVLIEVQEREPLVAWQTAASTTWVAADGTSLAATGAAPPLTLVDADGVAGDSNGALRRQVLADLQALHTARPDLANLYYGRQEGLYFLAPEGWTVYLGSGGKIADKLATLQTAQREISGRGAPPDVVDLRFEGRVYLR